MRTSISARNRALTEFAQAVNLRIRIRRDNGATEYRLLDAKGEPLCIDDTDEDAAQSIAVYAGSHPAFSEARVQYGYAIGEEQ